MSKTVAPLLSFDASGQIGKSMVYSKWRGITYARRYVIPANPRTSAQQQNRLAFAVLREMWKLLPASGRAPWEIFATGRQFTGVNAFIGENRRAQTTDTDFDEFIGSPGARGGLPAGGFSGVAGSGSGEIDLTFVAPEVPTDWEITYYRAVAFKQQDPVDRFPGPFFTAEIEAPTLVDTLSGLEAGEEYVIAGWVQWEKPNGQIAYGPSITVSVTSGA